MIATALGVALGPGSQCASSSDPACAALRDVYGQGAFNSLDGGNNGNSVFSSIGRAVSDFLQRVFGSIGTVPSVILIAAVLGAIVFFVARHLRRGSARVGTAGAASAVNDIGSPDADAEWREAERAAQRGDYREALRRGFRSALFDISARGRLAIDASFTTREILARVTADRDVADLLEPSAEAFDVAWYGRGDVSESQWESGRARYRELRSIARRRTAAPGSAA